MKAIRTISLTATLATALFSAPLSGRAADDTDKADKTSPSADASASTVGEVKKVDKDAGKITISHGPITNLQMPGMTMVFYVSDPALLDQVKQGDKILFRAESINGALTVTKIVAGR